MSIRPDNILQQSLQQAEGSGMTRFKIKIKLKLSCIVKFGVFLNIRRKKKKKEKKGILPARFDI